MMLPTVAPGTAAAPQQKKTRKSAGPWPLAAGLVAGLGFLAVLATVAAFATAAPSVTGVSPGEPAPGRRLQAPAVAAPVVPVAPVVAPVTPAPTGWAALKHRWWTTLVAFVLNAIIVLAIAHKYNENVIEHLDPLAKSAGTNRGDFTHGIFACFGDRDICLHAGFCNVIRLAHTWTVTGVVENFYKAILAVLCCQAFCPCCYLILRVHLRGAVRKALGVKANIVNDILCILFCQVCAAGQEAMDVDAEMGVDVHCCCNLEMSDVPGGSEEEYSEEEA